eukprot:11790442-Karenia_brevis.AAC.1
MVAEMLRPEPDWAEMDWKCFFAASKLLNEASENFMEIKNPVLKNLLVMYRGMLCVVKKQPLVLGLSRALFLEMAVFKLGLGTYVADQNLGLAMSAPMAVPEAHPAMVEVGKLLGSSWKKLRSQAGAHSAAVQLWSFVEAQKEEVAKQGQLPQAAPEGGLANEQGTGAEITAMCSKGEAAAPPAAATAPAA